MSKLSSQLGIIEYDNPDGKPKLYRVGIEDGLVDVMEFKRDEYGGGKYEPIFSLEFEVDTEFQTEQVVEKARKRIQEHGIEDREDYVATRLN